jgi:hypothetical protein
MAAGAVALAAGAARAQYTGVVTAGDLEFDLATQAPFPNMGPALLRPSNLISALEPTMSQVNQYLWFYYLAGDVRAFNFNDEGGQEVQVVGSTITVKQHYAGWDGVQTYTLAAGGPGVGSLHAQATVRNLGSSPLTIRLFHYADLDDNGTFTDDEATLDSPGVVTVTDSTGPFTLRLVADSTPTAYEASAWRTLLTNLANNGQTALNNVGLPLTADVTVAFQWDLVVPVGGEATVGDTITIINGSGEPTCYANCDQSTATPFLNIGDFVCFQQRFAAGDSWANCDGSSLPPVLNVGDFVCFQARFAAGCSAP